MTNALDRPIWHALKSRQAEFAVGEGPALRYVEDVSPFAAAADDEPESLADLARLIPPEQGIVLLQVSEGPLPPSTVEELSAKGVQMVARSVGPPDDTVPIVQLGEADAPEMLALATLTKPGPFLRRTHLFGGYCGIRIEGRLVAMAGERLKVPGHTEVSGVCTHPDFRGRGYAELLSRCVAARILARGETPFLHAWAYNAPAIGLYKKLGFVHRSDVSVKVLRHA